MLAIVVTACVILIVALPIDEDTKWKLAGLTIVAVWLLRALVKKQQRQERLQAGDQAIDQLFDAAASVRQARLSSQDPHRLNLQGPHDDEG